MKFKTEKQVKQTKPKFKKLNKNYKCVAILTKNKQKICKLIKSEVNEK